MTKQEEQKKTYVVYNKDIISNEIYSSITSIGSSTLTTFLSKNTQPCPEKLMFLSVIYQAILDATQIEKKNEPKDVTKNRKEAIEWFFNEEHVDDLSQICTLVDTDHNYLRRIVKKIINKDIPFHRRRINVLINELNLEMNRRD
jgi:hypothetical protein|tara:strand:+ start:6209 stop:6640 length:432 start_codon:yes stop_codon:yes gene_type:complete